MMKLLDKVEPMDIIAVVIIVACVVLLVNGIDDIFKQIPVYITMFYFGKHSNKKS